MQIHIKELLHHVGITFLNEKFKFSSFAIDTELKQPTLEIMIQLIYEMVY